MTDEAPPRDLLRDGIRLFNERYFFEAHEVWEEAWRIEHGEPRRFLQGLIQVAAGCHHLKNGNRSGGIALLRRALGKLDGYPPTYLGIDLNALRAEVERLRDTLDAGQYSAEQSDSALPVIRPS